MVKLKNKINNKNIVFYYINIIFINDSTKSKNGNNINYINDGNGGNIMNIKKIKKKVERQKNNFLHIRKITIEVGIKK